MIDARCSLSLIDLEAIDICHCMTILAKHNTLADYTDPANKDEILLTYNK